MAALTPPNPGWEAQLVSLLDSARIASIRAPLRSPSRPAAHGNAPPPFSFTPRLLRRPLSPPTVQPDPLPAQPSKPIPFSTDQAPMELDPANDHLAANANLPFGPLFIPSEPQLHRSARAHKPTKLLQRFHVGTKKRDKRTASPFKKAVQTAIAQAGIIRSLDNIQQDSLPLSDTEMTSLWSFCGLLPLSVDTPSPALSSQPPSGLNAKPDPDWSNYSYMNSKVGDNISGLDSPCASEDDVSDA